MLNKSILFILIWFHSVAFASSSDIDGCSEKNIISLLELKDPFLINDSFSELKKHRGGDEGVIACVEYLFNASMEKKNSSKVLAIYSIDYLIQEKNNGSSVDDDVLDNGYTLARSVAIEGENSLITFVAYSIIGQYDKIDGFQLLIELAKETDKNFRAIVVPLIGMTSAFDDKHFERFLDGLPSDKKKEAMSLMKDLRSGH